MSRMKGGEPHEITQRAKDERLKVTPPPQTEQKDGQPQLCNCDGHWHITNIPDGKGSFYSIDFDSQIKSILTASNRKLLERLLEEYGGNNFQMSDAAGHTHNIKAIPVQAIEAELSKLRREK